MKAVLVIALALTGGSYAKAAEPIGQDKSEVIPECRKTDLEPTGSASKANVGLLIGVHVLNASFSLGAVEYAGSLEVGLGVEHGPVAYSFFAGTERVYDNVAAEEEPGESGWGWSVGTSLVGKVPKSKVSLGANLEFGGDVSKTGPLGLKLNALLEIEIGRGCEIHVSAGTDLASSENHSYPWRSFTQFNGGLGFHCLISFTE